MSRMRTAAMIAGLSCALAASAMAVAAGVGPPGAPARAAPPETASLPEGIDYNCGLSGNGFPWLTYEPGEAPPGITGDSSAPAVARLGVFRSTVGPEYRVGLPLEGGPDGVLDAAGAVDLARVYRLLCRVHPDLGGSGLRSLSSQERDALSGDAAGNDPSATRDPDASSDSGASSDPDAGMGVCSCCWIPKDPDDRSDCWTSRLSIERYAEDPGLCDVSAVWACSWSPPSGSGTAETIGTAGWADFYTDETATGSGPIRAYWLAPLPQGLAEALQDEQGVDPDPDEDQERVTWQRWRVEVVGDELVYLDSRRAGAPGARQGVGFHYEIAAEFTVERPDEGWAFRGGYITAASITTSLQYGPEGDWTVSQMDCFGSRDYPRVIGGRFEAGLLQLEWPQHVASCAVFACHKSRACDLPEERGHWHHSDMFFKTISASVFALREGSLSGQDEIWEYMPDDGSLHRVAIEVTLKLLDQH